MQSSLILGTKLAQSQSLTTPTFGQPRLKRSASPENHNPWRQRGTALATRHPIQGLTARPSCLRDVPPGTRDIPGEGPRALATLSLADATGCDGGTLCVPPPLNTDAAGRSRGRLTLLRDGDKVMVYCHLPTASNAKPSSSNLKPHSSNLQGSCPWWMRFTHPEAR